MKECLDGYRVQSSLDDDASHEHIGFTLFKGTIWRPTDKQIWRAEGALRHLVASRDAVRGRDIEVVVGHLIHLIGIKSTVLSTLGATCVYIRRSYSYAQPLWQSVRTELHWLWSLLPLLFDELDKPWSPIAYSYDASLGGAGVCKTRLGLKRRGDTVRSSINSASVATIWPTRLKTRRLI